MIVVDSSVWIAHLRGQQTQPVRKLRSNPTPDEIIVGDLILLEVLRGARDEANAARLERNLRQFTLAPMLDDHLAVRAAANYRELRRRGSTVRKTVDVIIATFCLEHGHALLHDDRDFDPSRITSACGWLDERVARSGTTPVEIPPKPRAGTGGTGLTTQSKKGWLGFSEWPR